MNAKRQYDKITLEILKNTRDGDYHMEKYSQLNQVKQNNKHIYFSVRDDNIHGLSDGDLEVILDWLNTNI